MLVQHFEHLVGVIAELRPHGLPDDVDEAFAALVTLFDQSLDEPADLAQRLVDVGRVLPAVLVSRTIAYPR